MMGQLTSHRKSQDSGANYIHNPGKFSLQRAAIDSFRPESTGDAKTMKISEYSSRIGDYRHISAQRGTIL
jgi:hypothetical protein